MLTAKDSIWDRIKGFGEGSAFTPKDFTDLAARGTVDVMLSRLINDGKIRKIGRGLFDYPRTSTVFKDTRPPDINNAILAIGRKNRWIVVPHGAMAANMLGLSQQVPAKIVYLSSGPNKTYSIGEYKIYLHHISPRDLQSMHQISNTLIQAFRYLGQANIGSDEINGLSHKLSDEEKQQLLKDTRYQADWIYQTVRKIAEAKSK